MHSCCVESAACALQPGFCRVDAVCRLAQECNALSLTIFATKDGIQEQDIQLIAGCLAWLAAWRAQ